MKIAIMQPYFFPYIGYWQLIHSVDKFVIYDDVNYIKGGWINRNRILVNGIPQMINLRMYKASSNKLINEIELLNDNVYTAKLIKTIESNYKNAPYFEDVINIIVEILSYNNMNMAEYLHNLIVIICDYMKIDTEIIVSSSMLKDNSKKGQEKVIDICKTLYASEYINPIGGIELYSQNRFNEDGIKLYFLRTDEVIYKQEEDIFYPWLSIIDVLMYNSIDDIAKILNKYTLIEGA